MLTRLRWSAFGLRGRIVGMVLVTTVATLLVAALGLLPRLESSLRNASKATLEGDIKVRKSELESFASIPYKYVLLLQDAPLLAADPRLKQDAQEAGHLLNTGRTQLVTQLGASPVTLVGFIDPSGQGQPVLAGADPESTPAVTASSLSDATRAYLTGAPQYDFPTIGSTQFVRAAIPLPHADAVIVVYKSIDEIGDAVSAVRKAFELAALAGLLLTVLLAIPLAGALVRRLRRLRQAALRVAVAGAGAQFPVDRARDEVGDLARSFAIMQRRLRHQEEARRAFVATASHELRTPLASLDGMLELLAEDLRDPEPDLEDAEALLERARAQSRRLGRLAADLLDLSRIDAGVALRSEPVELGELARAVIAEFEIGLAEREVNAVLHEDAGGAVWALADPGSVARILRILLDNSVRVAPAGSDVVVTLAARPSPTVSVSDRGPGVAAEERALIFERFKRGRDTGGAAGFGLGLAIGRELAERMGGTLALADDAPPGATFSLTLPVAAPRATDAVPTTAAGEVR